MRMVIGWALPRALRRVVASREATRSRAADQRGLATVEVVVWLALLIGLGTLVAPLMSGGVLKSVGCVTQRLVSTVGGGVGESGACASGPVSVAAVPDGSALGTMGVSHGAAGDDVFGGGEVREDLQLEGEPLEDFAWVRDLSPDDITRLWPIIKDALVEVASQPNELEGRQLFWIWRNYWKSRLDNERGIQERLTAGLCEGAPAVDCPRWREYWDLTWKKRFDELEPKYRENAEQLEDIRTHLDGQGYVLGKLEDGKGGTWLTREEPRHYTLQEVNQLAIEGAWIKQRRDTLGGAFIFPLLRGSLLRGGPNIVGATRQGTSALPVTRIEASSELKRIGARGTGLEQSLSRSAAAQAKYQTAVEELRKAFIEARSRVSGGVPFPAELIAKVTKVAYYASKRGITNFDVFLSELKLQRFAKGVDLEKLTAEQMQALKAAFETGSKQLRSDAAKTAFSLQVPYKTGTRTLTFDEAGKILLDGVRLAPRKYDELYKQLGLTHADKGHGPNKRLLDVMHEAQQNAPYKSGKFASAQVFIESFAKAKAELDAGRFTLEQGARMVEFEVTPDVGRTFVRRALVPTGVTPMPPSTTPAGIRELVVTKVRAFFEADGTLKTIFPIGDP